MSPSPSPSPPRRLAVLRSHLLPDPAPPAADGERRRAAAVAVSTSACAGSGSSGPSEGKSPAGEEVGCVFCCIIRGDSPAFKIYEDDVCLCILDTHPLSLGHSLIIPKCHFPSLEATPPPVIAGMCSKVPFLSNAIMKATQCDSFNLVVNNGAAAGQVIFHTHFHIIPRRAGDKLWPSESFIRRSIEQNQETLDLVSCIKEQLYSSSGEYKTEASLIPKML